MKRNIGHLAAALLIAAAGNAAAQSSGEELVAGKIAGNFTTLAGSEENALALVKALRAGETVQLTYAPAGTATTPTIASIDPPTGAMGWGNVKISLGLAQDQLRRLGITNPTPEQLQAALNGGDVSVTRADGTTTTTTLRGVLQMRADGMGWGRIAQVGGTKVGPVVSKLDMGNTKATTGATTAANAAASTVKATGVTTATNARVTAGGKGITTGADASAAKGANSSRGLTTAGGVAAPASARGITTAQGATAAAHGNAYGRGIVTASGGSGASVAATSHGKPSGVGVVNAGGNGHGRGADHGKGKGG